MVFLWFLIVGITFFGALLLFGVRKNRPRRVECVCGWFICLMLLASYGQSTNQTNVENIAQKQFDSTVDFTNCFSEWVEYVEKDLIYTAADTMVACAITLIDKTTANLNDFMELTE